MRGFSSESPVRILAASYSDGARKLTQSLAMITFSFSASTGQFISRFDVVPLCAFCIVVIDIRIFGMPR